MRLPGWVGVGLRELIGILVNVAELTKVPIGHPSIVLVLICSLLHDHLLLWKLALEVKLLRILVLHCDTGVRQHLLEVLSVNSWL